MATTEKGKEESEMLLMNDFAGECVMTTLSADAAYHRLAPVPLSLSGTGLPSSAIELRTVEGMTDVHGTDMGAAVSIERLRDGSAVGLSDRVQPALGLQKRHGATRGRPPREHLRAC